ncbi:hypothetical protein [Rodentibacter haemolyticus]|nr:hypothetical protein [Rodentibacter haemolyticus]
MSIKPKYADKIFLGEKLYELRRKIFKKRVNTIIVYSSAPIMKVVGEFEIDDIIVSTPEEIFRKFNSYICILKEDYFSYFLGADIAYAIKVGKVIKYSETKDLSDFGINRAPQSYIYIE